MCVDGTVVDCQHRGIGVGVARSNPRDLRPKLAQTFKYRGFGPLREATPAVHRLDACVLLERSVRYPRLEGDLCATNAFSVRIANEDGPLVAA